jgi:hypothetical protein
MLGRRYIDRWTMDPVEGFNMLAISRKHLEMLGYNGQENLSRKSLKKISLENLSLSLENLSL